jgi:hypothetical protein
MVTYRLFSRGFNTTYTVQDEEYQHYITGINQVLKLSWQITNNIKKLGGQNDNENKMMITTDDKIRLQELSVINYCCK